ncbi:hypothetical protein FWH09_02390, partial [Candidatus Saccharibacteria bacterium]|nr:hypothetical protein [Candidatus Saccharibacteria bacterium]
SYGQKTLYGRGGETSKLRALLENYGPLIVQKQIEPPEVILNGIPHIYGDRPFFTRANGKYQFAGGFRLFIPSDSIDGQKRMIHGTKNTVYAPLF